MTGYFDAMRDADESLDDALACIRSEEEAHRITPAQAATERVQVLERHIAECKRLRGEYHVGTDTEGPGQ